MKKELPARLEEIHHAKEEGVILDVLTNPTEILTDEKGWVKGIKCIRMKLERKILQEEEDQLKLKIQSLLWK